MEDIRAESLFQVSIRASQRNFWFISLTLPSCLCGSETFNGLWSSEISVRNSSWFKSPSHYIKACRFPHAGFLTPWKADLSQILVLQWGILGWGLGNAFDFFFFPSLPVWKVVMKIPGSWPACGMCCSRNVSGALCYGSALIRFISRKLDFCPHSPPLFMAKKVNLAKVKHFIAQAAAAFAGSPCQASVKKETWGSNLSLHVSVSSSQDFSQAFSF